MILIADWLGFDYFPNGQYNDIAHAEHGGADSGHKACACVNSRVRSVVLGRLCYRGGKREKKNNVD